MWGRQGGSGERGVIGWGGGVPQHQLPMDTIRPDGTVAGNGGAIGGRGRVCSKQDTESRVRVEGSCARVRGSDDDRGGFPVVAWGPYQWKVVRGAKSEFD